MKRVDVLLAALAAPERKSFYPVHLQKTLFLVDRTLPKLFEQRYAFEPYDYGPFDKDVYSDAEKLKADGYVSIGQEPGNWCRTYRVTNAGLQRGEQLLNEMPAASAAMVRKIDLRLIPVASPAVSSHVTFEPGELKREEEAAYRRADHRHPSRS